MTTHLSHEVENGRLLRLLVKLGFVNERPDSDTDPNWSETGDRYLLKLFRDYVFHRCSEEGSPVLDFGQVGAVSSVCSSGELNRWAAL